MSDQNKQKENVTPANAAAAAEAEKEKEKWKKENPLGDRMSKLADAASGGTSTGKGLASLGAQIAASVKEARGGDEVGSNNNHLSVSQVTKYL